MPGQDSNITCERYLKDLIGVNKRYDDPLIKEAFETAKRLHEGQLRKSGENYIIHPIAVSLILADLGMDNETIIAGLLHDVVEDTDYTREQLVEDFNESIAELVDGVTKLGNIKFESKEEFQAENFRKLFLAMSKDIRVLIIKLADRLHNMRTLEYMSTNKRESKALETIEIYAPLAGRLGIYSIKFELEDLALRYLHPLEYNKLKSQVDDKTSRFQVNIDKLVKTIDEELTNSGMEHEIYGRAKHLYSIYNKMQRQHKGLDEIFDLFAVRVLVSSVRDCYAVLGIVHNKWMPIPGRLKDYIAMPKPNMYQSLHTTVIGDNGEPFEIQIRTYEMHRVAEYGIAAHWKYKQGVSENNESEEEKLVWLRQALEWQKEADDSIDFLESVKVDLFNNQVFVFTPKGDVFELPAESTPLDFAFKIHTDVGIKCVGAKVNGKMVTIDHMLLNGDIVEIVTSPNSAGPSMDWLKIAKSSEAKHKIRNWLRKANQDDDVVKGRDNINSYIKKQGYNPVDVAKNSYILRAVKEFNCDSVNELFLQISRGGGTVSKLGQTLISYYLDDQSEKKPQEIIKTKPKPSSRGSIGSDKGIVVRGASNLLIKRATCCNPLPGDSIIGFITKGNGIHVHRTDCPNITALTEPEDIERFIEVEWEHPDKDQSYYVNLVIKAADRKGLLKDISKICDDNDISIAAIKMDQAEASEITINMSIEIQDSHQLQHILKSIRLIDSVSKAHRE